MKSDPIREENITSTETMVGSEGNLLKPTPESCRMIKINSPVLTQPIGLFLPSASSPSPMSLIKTNTRKIPARIL
jgi:glutamate synthase (ferredoxin)